MQLASMGLCLGSYDKNDVQNEKYHLQFITVKPN